MILWSKPGLVDILHDKNFLIVICEVFVCVILKDKENQDYNLKLITSMRTYKFIIGMQYFLATSSYILHVYCSILKNERFILPFWYSDENVSRREY